ncbi:hypothetical protein F5X98DRAFT_358684 [Xylaria grammica]|nr:hypothetical protein F5X98DRAFT_358684 [Xylaria grammica]
MLRFAYIRLSEAINTHDMSLIKQRRDGSFKGKRGQSNASVAMDIYLQAQEKPRASRAVLSEAVRTGKRWLCLVRRSPVELGLYPPLAESVIGNNSILKRSLGALSEEVAHVYPDIQNLLETSVLCDHV